MHGNRHESNVRKALTAQRIRTVREKLFELTRDGQPARILVVAMAAGESESFIRNAYQAGKLHGYQHTAGEDGGFRRILKVV